MKYVIRFSEPGISINGKPVEEVISKLLREKIFNIRLQIETIPDGSGKKGLQSDLAALEKDIRESVKDMREVEKDILDGLLAAKIKDTPKASDAYGAMDFADRIQNSEGEIVFDDSDLKLLQDSYEKSTKQDIWYTSKLRNLMRQIMKPVEFKELTAEAVGK
jgi:hypothetical protein